MSRNSASFDIFKTLHLIKEKWYICVSFAIIFSLITSFYFIYMKDNQYIASTTIFVYSESSSPTVEGGINYNDVLTAEKLAKDCQVIATSNSVLNEVCANIPDIPVNPENISVSLMSNSRIIRLSVVDTNPKNAAEIANNVSDILIKVAMDKAKIQDMEVIDYANIPLSPVSVNVILYIAISALAGAIVAIGIILLMAVFNQTIHTAEDITDNFDIAVLVSIPEFSVLEKELNDKNKHNHSKRPKQTQSHFEEELK